MHATYYSTHSKHKSSACPTPEGQRRLLHHIQKHLPRPKNATFTDAVLYLGLLIGPGATQKQYATPLRKFHTAVSHIRSLNPGLAPSIPLYSQQAFPILSWKSSFIHPDHNTLQQEARSLQLLTNGPYNAIPNNLLYNLKQIGLPAQAHSLRTTSIASRTRNALYTMHNYHHNTTMLLQHCDHDETILDPPLRFWIDNSITMSLYNAVQHTHPLMSQIKEKHPQNNSTTTAINT